MLSKADPVIHSILVRAPNWIGDCIMSSRAIHHLRRLFPDSRIDLICRPHLVDLFRLGIPLDRIITVQTGNSRERIAATVKTIRRQGTAYDLGLLFTNSFASALEFRLAGIRRCLGYARDGRAFLLSHAQPNPGPIHQTDYYERLLQAFGRPLPLPVANPLRIPDEKKDELDRRLQQLGVNLKPAPIVIAPGAAFGSAKQWLKERFAAVIRRMMEDYPERTVVCLGGQAERPLIQEILTGLDSSVCCNLAGLLPLDLSLTLIAGAVCALANDSGLMHAAWALNVPLLALFGPNDPQVSGPLAADSRVIYKAVECSPCPHRHCPIDHRCMTAISVDEVVQGLADLLALREKTAVGQTGGTGG